MCLHFRAMISKKSVAYFRNAYLFKLGLTSWGLWDRPQGLNGPLSSSYLKFITLSLSKINLNKNGNIFHRTYKTYLFQNQHSPRITYNSFQGLIDVWFRQFWDMMQTWKLRQWNGDMTVVYWRFGDSYELSISISNDWTSYKKGFMIYNYIHSIN